MPKRLKGVANLPFPPIVAGLYGIVAGFLVFSTPQWLFEHWIDISGVANFIPAAAPPLGEKARLLSAGASVVGVGLLLWPVLAMGQSLIRKMRKKEVVHVRARGIVVAESLDTAYTPPLDLQADAPDFRSPIFAEGELGAPLMSDAALEAADELVLQDSIDGPLLAPRGKAQPSVEASDPVAELPPLANFAPNLAEEAEAILASTAPVEAAARLSSPPPPAFPVSQFQLPGDDLEDDLVAIAPFDLDALEEELADEPVAEALPLTEERVEPAEDPLFGQSFRIPRREDNPVAAVVPEAAAPVSHESHAYVAPKSALAPETPAPVSIDPFAMPGRTPQAPAAEEDGLSFSSMRVNLSRSIAAPVPEPVAEVAPEPVDAPVVASHSAPVVVPAPVAAPIAAPAGAPVADSVAGLMDRLNAAMGGRVRKPATPVAAPHPASDFDALHMSLGLGGRRAI
jgi:hypothetical protein